MNIKMRIKQWLRDFLHPIVWDDLGLRVIKRELDDTWQVVQDLKYQVRKLIEGKEVMFNETDNGQAKVYSLNVDWVEKYEKLRKLAEDLKQTLWEVKKEMQHHKDFGTALFWENDLIEKIDNAIGYYISEVD